MKTKLLAVLALLLPLIASGSTPSFAQASSVGVAHAARVCDVGPADSAACLAIRVDKTDAITGQPMAYTATSGFTAQQLRTAYQVTGQGNPNMVIAIVDAYDIASAAADLTAYRSAMGLPAIDTTCTVSASGGKFTLGPSATVGKPCFAKVNQSGSMSNLPVQNAGWGQEIDLDIEMASAICPLCSIVLVEGSSSSLSALNTAVNTAAAFNGVAAISNSYGTGVGTDVSSTSYPAYANASNKGIAVVSASGDSGYGVSFPASVPQGIAVGGTSMTLNADNTLKSQTVWNGTGSGCSLYNKALTWQPTSAACGTFRATNDVAAVADPNTGVSVYNAGGWLVFGGTSVATPIVAAWLAINGGYSATLTPSEFVWTKLTWTDVTSGTNGTCTTTVLCSAAVGWDGPTGLGALPAAGLIATAPAAPTGLAVGSKTATSVGLTWTAPATNGSAITDYVVQYGTDAAFATNTTTTNTGSATAAYTVSGLTTGSTYYFRVAAVNAVGTSAYSSSVTAVPAAPTAPSAPSGLTATPGLGSVALSWTAPANGGSPITGYQVYVSTDPFMASGVSTASTGSTATTFTVTGLTGGTTYYFAVAAVNSVGTSALSPIVSAIPQVNTVPAAPTNFTATPSAKRVISFSWTAPTSASPISEYRIQYNTANAFSASTAYVSVSGTATSTRVSGFKSGVRYYFRIAAVNSAGLGAWSSVISTVSL